MPASCEGPWGGMALVSGPVPAVSLGRETCGELEVAERREWLAANGRGSYASGTVPNMLTRGYHGLLVAALSPPLGRTVMLVKADATVAYRGSSYDLFANRWSGGAVVPAGHTLIERFWLDGTIPVWRFACGEALVEQRIWMEHGADTTYVRYTMAAAREPASFSVKAIVDYRDYHGRTGASPWATRYETIERGMRVTAFPGARSLILQTDAGDVSIANQWYTGFDLARERERGLQDREDHLHAVTFHAQVKPGESLILVASTEEAARPDPAALDRRRAYEKGLLRTWSGTRPEGESAPAWLSQLVLAADQFIVARQTDAGADGRTVIAGYHWFGDWGRDTMISLPGLTLVTGRPGVARGILQTFSRYVSQGMLPNRFPDQGETPEYNTVDATLWYFEAIRAYHEWTGDDDFLNEVFPVLDDIITQHLRGTRYHIKVDQADGLLSAGEAGVQLTWMDAIVNGRAITPRTGKPVEVNALVVQRAREHGGIRRAAGIAGGHVPGPGRQGPAPDSSGSGTPRSAIASTCSTVRPATMTGCGPISSSRSRCPHPRCLPTGSAAWWTRASASCSPRRGSATLAPKRSGTTAGPTAATSPTATRPTTRAPSGVGSSGRLSRPISAFMATPTGPSPSCGPSWISSAPWGWAASARSPRANPRCGPWAALPRPGAWPRRYAPGTWSSGPGAPDRPPPPNPNHGLR